MRGRLWALMTVLGVAGVLIFAACSGAGAETGGPIEDGAPPQGEEDLGGPDGERPPDVTADVSGTEVTATLGTYLWGTVIADSFGVVTQADALPLDRGDAVVFGLPPDPPAQSATVSVARVTEATPHTGGDHVIWRPDAPLGTETVQVAEAVTYALDVAPGTYVVELQVDYGREGSAGYGVLVEVR